MTDNESKYNIYMLHRLLAGIFGETYAITTGTEIAPEEYRAEHFILTQRPTEALHIGRSAIFGQSLPAELGRVDIDSAMDEAYRQVEIDLALLLEKRAKELNRPDLSYLPVELKPRTGSLLSCSVRGCFTKQLMVIKDTTKCPKLVRYFRLLQQNSVNSRVL